MGVACSNTFICKRQGIRWVWPVGCSFANSWCKQDFNWKKAKIYWYSAPVLCFPSNCSYAKQLLSFFLWFVKTLGAFCILSLIPSARKTSSGFQNHCAVLPLLDSCADVSLLSIINVFPPEEKLYLWLPCVVRKEIKCPTTKEPALWNSSNQETSLIHSEG